MNRESAEIVVDHHLEKGCVDTIFFEDKTPLNLLLVFLLRGFQISSITKDYDSCGAGKGFSCGWGLGGSFGLEYGSEFFGGGISLGRDGETRCEYLPFHMEMEKIKEGDGVFYPCPEDHKEELSLLWTISLPSSIEIYSGFTNKILYIHNTFRCESML